MPEIKKKKAIKGRKLASPRSCTRAKTKTAIAKKVSTPKNKSRPTAKRKKATPIAKRLVKKPTPGTRPSPGAAAQQPKPARKPKGAPRVAATKPPQKNGSRKSARDPSPAIPAFLLEGDEPSFLTEAGAAEKFALGPTAPPDHFDEGNTPLPASYGTGKLFLTARDPHWLYAHWDFSHEDQFHHNARSADRHLILRIHDEAMPAKYISEIHVHPESKHWFVHVETAGTQYSVELGYYQTGRKWKSLATSAPMYTPPDNISADTTVEFATIPLELSFGTMLALLKEHSDDDAGQTIPLARAIEIIRAASRHDFPEPLHVAGWTSEQEQVLAEILAAGRAGFALPSSQDLTGEKNGPVGDSPFGESSSSCTSSFLGDVTDGRTTEIYGLVGTPPLEND